MGCVAHKPTSGSIRKTRLPTRKTGAGASCGADPRNRSTFLPVGSCCPASQASKVPGSTRSDSAKFRCEIPNIFLTVAKHVGSVWAMERGYISES